MSLRFTITPLLLLTHIINISLYYNTTINTLFFTSSSRIFRLNIGHIALLRFIYAWLSLQYSSLAQSFHASSLPLTVATLTPRHAVIACLIYATPTLSMATPSAMFRALHLPHAFNIYRRHVILRCCHFSSLITSLRHWRRYARHASHTDTLYYCHQLAWLGQFTSSSLG